MQLIGGLADEKIRWGEAVKTFDAMLFNVVGDIMIAAGAVAYLGTFTVSLDISGYSCILPVPLYPPLSLPCMVG